MKNMASIQRKVPLLLFALTSVCLLFLLGRYSILIRVDISLVTTLDDHQVIEKFFDGFAIRQNKLPNIYIPFTG